MVRHIADGSACGMAIDVSNRRHSVMAAMNSYEFTIINIIAVAAVFSKRTVLVCACMEHGFAWVSDLCALDGTHPAVFAEISIA